MTAALAVSAATFEIRRYPEMSAFRDHLLGEAHGAAQAGSSLLVIPELSCLGLLWTHPRAGEVRLSDLSVFYRDVLTPLYPTYCEVLAEVARTTGITIAGASFWHEQECKAVNSGLLAGPDGVVRRQDKLHMTRGERAIGTSGGNGVELFEVDGVMAAMAICYDVQFPELIRVLADAGAEVILVPSLTDQRGSWRVRLCAHARAIENQVYVVTAPLIGDLGIPFEKPVTCCGGALIACPIDNKLGSEDGVYAAASPDHPGLLHAKLDMEVLRLSRERAEIRPFSQRRPDVYEAIAADLGLRA